MHLLTNQTVGIHVPVPQDDFDMGVATEQQAPQAAETHVFDLSTAGSSCSTLF